jgi:predicted Zn-dependent peptidase
MYEKTTLPNGLRIVSSFMPHTRSVTVSLYLGAGSRYETDPEAGISHFIEHMCFKGTQRRPTAQEISEAIEGVGGVMNAATGKERTVYWCKVARPHFELALDVLVDMLRDSRFDPEEIEKERKVVLEELSTVYDTPHELVDVLIDEVVWPAQPLGRDVAGTKDSVSGISRQMMLEYIEHHYTPRNTVVAISGAVEHAEIVEKVGKLLGDWTAADPAPWFPAVDGQTAPRARVEHKPTEQAHLCLATGGLPTLHPDRFVLDLMNVVLGEGMSSRLFLEVREKRGLAYDVHSYVSRFLDSGALTIYAGVDPKRIAETIGSVMQELGRLKDEPVPETEIVKVKEFTKGRLLLSMEDTRSVASWLGGQELLTNQILSVDEVVDQVERVTSADVRRLANDLFVPERLNLAVVGPYPKRKRFQPMLKF